MYNVKIINVNSNYHLLRSDTDWDKWGQAYLWCRDNLGNSEKAVWYNNPREGYYCFVKKVDATAFKLKFGI
jgi:hypothetical protein